MSGMRERQGTQDLDEKKDDLPIWGKLLSLNKQKTNSFELREKDITLGRNNNNTVWINDARLSGTHCKFTFDSENVTAKLTDLSTNGTYLGDQKIGKGNEIMIKSGDEIYILHRSKVNESESLGFAFFQTLNPEQKSSIILPNPVNEEENKKQELKMKKLDELGEDFNCPICDDLVYQGVTLMPCLHNFCGSCFSDWMKKQKTCPTCRNDVESVKRNATINSVIDKFLQANPQRRRPDAEYKMMSENNKINQDVIKFTAETKSLPPQPMQLIQQAPARPPVRGAARGRGRGGAIAPQRKVSDYSASSDSDNDPGNKGCVSCLKKVQNFSCQKGQKHAICVNCKRAFPDRNLSQAENQQLFHKCSICNVFICNLVLPDCTKHKGGRSLVLLKNLPPKDITLALFRDNKFEFQVFRDYMASNRLTPAAIFQNFLQTFIVPGQFRYVWNKRIQKDVAQDIDVVLSPDSPICNICDVWFQIIFRYRISIKDKLPPNVKNRGVCWYGINCSTMKHNVDHAQKLDHMGEQTKF